MRLFLIGFVVGAVASWGIAVVACLLADWWDRAEFAAKWNRHWGDA